MKTIVLFLILFSNASFAGGEVNSAMLYLPDLAMKDRVKVDDLSKYIAEVSGIVKAHFKNTDVSSGIALVFALRDDKARYWMAVLEGEEDGLAMDILAADIKSVGTPIVKNGVVPFALSIQTGESKFVLSEPPIIPEWHKYLDGKTEISEAIGKAW